jgi:hypothetical protein
MSSILPSDSLRFHPCLWLPPILIPGLITFVHRYGFHFHFVMFCLQLVECDSLLPNS